MISITIAQGHEVRFMGFATSRMRKVAARQITSVRDGKQMHIPAHKRVWFSVGAVLAQAAHRPEQAPETAACRKGGRPPIGQKSLVLLLLVWYLDEAHHRVKEEEARDMLEDRSEHPQGKTAIGYKGKER